MTKDIRVLRRPLSGRSLTVAVAICLSMVVAASVIFQGAVVAETQERALASVTETGKAFTAVTKKVSPAVVFIKATKQVVPTSDVQGFGDMQGQIPDEMLKRFFGDAMPQFKSPGKRQPAVGQGSGFIISHDGYILTNNHVVGEADKLEVTLHDGRVLAAELVGTDAHTDVAIIKIEGKKLPVLSMGDSDQIEVGEWVLAVGSPFGLTGTVTSGIVSAKGRDSMGITDYEDFIQTDAAINPGNSGGPLVNLRGEAIGINTAIMSRSGGYNGIGFAIPMNMAKQICNQLMENGAVTRGFLGTMIQPLTADLAASFSLESSAGVLIGDVTPNGPAAEAGLQRGDVVVSLNGKPVTDVSSFRNKVAMIQPGKQAALAVIRNGKSKTINVKVGKLDNDTSAVATVEKPVSTLGLSVQDVDAQLAEKLGVKANSGVVITEVDPGSNAASQGLRPGMVIREVNHQEIRNSRQFADAVTDKKGGESLLLLVQQGDHTRFVVLKKTA